MVTMCTFKETDFEDLGSNRSSTKRLCSCKKPRVDKIHSKMLIYINKLVLKFVSNFAVSGRLRYITSLFALFYIFLYNVFVGLYRIYVTLKVEEVLK